MVDQVIMLLHQQVEVVQVEYCGRVILQILRLDNNLQSLLVQELRHQQLEMSMAIPVTTPL